MVEAGIGVILLSSEVPEVFGMADRIFSVERWPDYRGIWHG